MLPGRAVALRATSWLAEAHCHSIPFSSPVTFCLNLTQVFTLSILVFWAIPVYTSALPRGSLFFTSRGPLSWLARTPIAVRAHQSKSQSGNAKRETRNANSYLRIQFQFTSVHFSFVLVSLLYIASHASLCSQAFRSLLSLNVYSIFQPALVKRSSSV